MRLKVLDVVVAERSIELVHQGDLVFDTVHKATALETPSLACPCPADFSVVRGFCIEVFVAKQQMVDVHEPEMKLLQGWGAEPSGVGSANAMLAALQEHICTGQQRTAKGRIPSLS
jgi:hypothetical protein